MKVIIKMSRQNAAFEDSNREGETARLLRKMVDRIEFGDEGGLFIDSNGNRVGSWEMTANSRNGN